MRAAILVSAPAKRLAFFSRSGIRPQPAMEAIALMAAAGSIPATVKKSGRQLFPRQSSKSPPPNLVLATPIPPPSRPERHRAVFPAPASTAVQQGVTGHVDDLGSQEMLVEVSGDA
ncbi:hypothetical protein [Geomonas sp. Red276]